MSYIKDTFLLTNNFSQQLYAYAKDMPICDYHCHLSEAEIEQDKPFADLFEIMLKGDHYKWRLMRNYGIDEASITGEASNKQKFKAFCTALQSAFGNPLYHWSQLELQKYFDCSLTINEQNADAIWEQCNAYIKDNKLSPSSFIEQSKVSHVFTTNEIFDDLTVFERLAKKGNKFSVLPSFRADKIMNLENASYLTFLGKLEALTHSIKNIADLKCAIEKRLLSFIDVGCKASDIALEQVYSVPTEEEANAVFMARLAGENLTEDRINVFKGYLVYFLMELFAKHKITTQIHIGAMRNNNTIMYNQLGLDSGYDSIASPFNSQLLSKLFDKLNNKGALPKCILFNLNENMNSQIMTLIGCFQSSEAHGKIQFGPAWWFLDNIKGMKENLEWLSALGHLGTNIGMLTDSRSFLSYARHDYFRRILCDYLGTLMLNNLITQDVAFVGKSISDISYNNAIAYFKL